MIRLTLIVLGIVSLSGCALPNIDYSAYRKNRPHSILVLPPLNATAQNELAGYGFLATLTKPLSEAGYYVFPVALVDQTLKENGALTPKEMHRLELGKLREMFGADAVMYITVSQYGYVNEREVVVAAKAHLVDARTGESLLAIQSAAGLPKEKRYPGGNLSRNELLFVFLLAAFEPKPDEWILPQETAGLLSWDMFGARPYRLLYGPYSSHFGKDNVSCSPFHYTNLRQRYPVYSWCD